MNDSIAGRENGHDDRIDVEKRTRRALEQPLSVLSVDGTPIDDDVVLDDYTDSDGERPADCDCVEFHADAALPCWPCYRDGFEDPAPTGDTDADSTPRSGSRLGSEQS